MKIIIDILAVALCVSIAYAYYKKGFFISLVNFCVFLIALYITKFLCTFLQAPLAQLLTHKIPENIPPAIHTVLSNFGSSLPQVLAYLIILLIISAMLIALLLPLAKMVNLVLKFPILKQINQLLGAIFGLFIGALCAYFVLILFWPAIQASLFPQTALQNPANSIVLHTIQQVISAVLMTLKVI